MLTQARLHELLNYDPETGQFHWRVKVGRANAGAEACPSLGKGGYKRLCIGRKMYAQHRLAWLYMTGEWPEHEIDHRDLNRTNNRWTNLRPATRKQNAENTTGMRGSDHVVGVYWNKQRRRWQASITHYGRTIALGLYRSHGEAKSARLAGERRYFTHARSLRA